MAKHVLLVLAAAVALTGIFGVLNSYEPLLQMAAIFTAIFVVVTGKTLIGRASIGQEKRSHANIQTTHQDS